jgi:hypothetical protein
VPRTLTALNIHNRLHHFRTPLENGDDNDSLAKVILEGFDPDRSLVVVCVGANYSPIRSTGSRLPALVFDALGRGRDRALDVRQRD